MPIYQYECLECGRVDDWPIPIEDVEEQMVLLCSCAGVDDAGVAGETPHKRIYSFGLGRVNGAGGSPGRFGSKRD